MRAGYCTMRRARAVVPGGRQLVRKSFVTPVNHRRAERDRLDGDALPVHVRDAQLQVHELWLPSHCHPPASYRRSRLPWCETPRRTVCRPRQSRRKTTADNSAHECRQAEPRKPFVLCLVCSASSVCVSADAPGVCPAAAAAAAATPAFSSPRRDSWRPQPQSLSECIVSPPSQVPSIQQQQPWSIHSESSIRARSNGRAKSSL